MMMTVSANAQQLIDAIESMEQGIALFDADDRLVLCNQTFRGVFEDSAAPVVPGATFETMIRSIAANGLIADAQEREEDWVRDRLATGLGLSVVHGIVSDHAGAISVDSTPGAGATFEVIVPIYSGDQKPLAPAEPSEPAERRGRVLFVDDEVHLVKMAEKVLGRLGYSVVGETNGHDALDRFRADPAAFDLVVTDQTMPEITGDVLAGEVRKLRRDIPIVLCTGHSRRLTPEQAKIIGIDHYVMKPLLADELGNVVGNALESGTDR